MTRHWLAALGVALGLTAARGAHSHACSDEATRGHLGVHSFARSDADRNGEVSAAEARAVALKLFDGLDGDGNGVVTRLEAQQGAGAWREQRFDERFVELDRDGDAELTLDEMGMLPRRFRRLDHDGDGRLTRSELKRVFFPRPGRRGAALSAGFLRWDSDRDGRVTAAEARHSADLRLARQDRNGDGVLTCGEAHAGASPRSAGSKR